MKGAGEGRQAYTYFSLLTIKNVKANNKTETSIQSREQGRSIDAAAGSSELAAS